MHMYSYTTLVSSQNEILLCISNDRRILRDFLFSLPFSLIAYLSPYTFQRTSALSLSDCDTQSAKPGPNGSYRAPRSHTRPHDDEYCAISPDTLHICVSFRPCGVLPYLCARALSLLFSLPFVLRRSKEWRRWRLITTQSPLPVRPGLRPVPRKQQPPFAALGHSPPRYRCCKTNNLRPVCRGKKEHRSPRFPPSFRQITGGPTDRPTTGIRGIHRGE